VSLADAATDATQVDISVQYLVADITDAGIPGFI
jgi:hypothetical protein